MTHTLESLKAWLADDSNFIAGKHKLNDQNWARNDVNYYGVRRPFTCSNNLTASIQQSATHYCTPDSVEMWCCQHHNMLTPYGDGDNPYARVPLTVVVDYLNWLETQ